MKRVHRKIIKDIYRSRITSFTEFIERYIITNKKLPKGFESEYQMPGEKVKTKNFFIGSRDTSDEKLQAYKECYRILASHGFIKTTPNPPLYKIRLVHEYEDGKFADYDPYFMYHDICCHKISPRKNKLKLFINRGCRTKEEFKLYLKNICRFAGIVILFIITVITFVILIKNDCFHRTSQINQQEKVGSQTDTLQVK